MVSNVYLSVKSQRGEGDTYVSTNCVNWAFTAKLYKGNNALRVYAVSGHHLTNSVAITVFRGSKDFRIKKVIVNKKRTGLNFYISNITQTNLVSVSPNGEGSVTLGPLTFPLEQGAWTKANTFVSNYKKKTSDDKVTGKIHSKPNKDFFKCNLKTFTTSSAYCEGLQNIPFNSSVPFKVKIGDYETSTNIFLDSKGKFKSTAPWF